MHRPPTEADTPAQSSPPAPSCCGWSQAACGSCWWPGGPPHPGTITTTILVFVFYWWTSQSEQVYHCIKIFPVKSSQQLDMNSHLTGRAANPLNNEPRPTMLRANTFVQRRFILIIWKTVVYIIPHFYLLKYLLHIRRNSNSKSTGKFYYNKPKKGL